MGRQQLFLKLLCRHALVCLPVILTLFFERLWKIASSGKSPFFYLGLGQPRTKSSSTQFFRLPRPPLSFFTCDYGPWHGPQAQCERWMYIIGLMTPPPHTHTHTHTHIYIFTRYPSIFGLNICKSTLGMNPLVNFNKYKPLARMNPSTLWTKQT